MAQGQLPFGPANLDLSRQQSSPLLLCLGSLSMSKRGPPSLVVRDARAKLQKLMEQEGLSRGKGVQVSGARSRSLRFKTRDSLVGLFPASLLLSEMKDGFNSL